MISFFKQMSVITNLIIYDTYKKYFRGDTIE